MRLYKNGVALMLHFMGVVWMKLTDFLWGDNDDPMVGRTFSGRYSLVSIYDTIESVFVPVPINNDNRYYLQLKIDENYDPTDNVVPYEVNIRISNVLFTSMNLSATIAASGYAAILGMNPIASTLRLPPPEEWVVELALASILANCTQLGFLKDVNNNTQLVWDGSAGTVAWRRY
jgi:hypothetical protein